MGILDSKEVKFLSMNADGTENYGANFKELSVLGVKVALDIIKAEEVVEAKTLLAIDSGKTLFFNHADGISITLPAKALGLRFDVKVKVAPTSGNHVLATPDGAKIIQGGAIVNGGDVPAVLEEQINFVENLSLVGDGASIFCDGDIWYADGRSGTTSALTFTAPT